MSAKDIPKQNNMEKFEIREQSKNKTEAKWKYKVRRFDVKRSPLEGLISLTASEPKSGRNRCRVGRTLADCFCLCLLGCVSMSPCMFCAQESPKKEEISVLG